MNKIFFLIFILISFATAYSQRAFTFDLFTAQLQDSLLTVKDNGGKIVYEMTFNSPHDYTVDLDGDGVNEYIVIDSSGTQDLPNYYIYIFNTIDEFSLADSINSGNTEPYDMVSKEEGGEIIVTGNAAFEFFNDNDSDSDVFLPINCWKYESGQVYLINSDIYDLFISENEEIIDYLDSFTEQSEYNCDLSRKNKSAIAAAYANYMNAAEVTIASHFIKKYYVCADLNDFLRDINQLLTQGDSQ